MEVRRARNVWACRVTPPPCLPQAPWRKHRCNQVMTYRIASRWSLAPNFGVLCARKCPGFTDYWIFPSLLGTTFRQLCSGLRVAMSFFAFCISCHEQASSEWMLCSFLWRLVHLYFYGPKDWWLMNMKFSWKVDFLYLKRLIVLEAISYPVLQFCLANVKFFPVRLP